MSVGWIAEVLAEFQLLLREAVEVVLAGELNGRRMWCCGLHHHFTLEIPPPRPSGHLGDELEGALAGAEVGGVQANVRVENADQGDIGEMQTLGDHLGADEDVDLVRLEGI